MQNQMKLVVEGLSQLVTAVSNSSQIQNKANLEYMQNCWLHANGNHDISNCDTFNSMAVPIRVDAAKQPFVFCFCCLKPGHTARRCFNRTACIIKDSNGQLWQIPSSEITRKCYKPFNS